MNTQSQAKISNSKNKKWMLWTLFSIGIAAIILPLVWCHLVSVMQIFLGLAIIHQVKDSKNKDYRNAGYILAIAMILAGIIVTTIKVLN